MLQMFGVMQMNKIQMLRAKLDKMKQRRGQDIQKKIFKFQPFSVKQKKVLTWWVPASPVKDYDGIIADGAIRSGKNYLHVTIFCYVGNGDIQWSKLWYVRKDNWFF